MQTNSMNWMTLPSLQHPQHPRLRLRLPPRQLQLLQPPPPLR
jgi:hypothetical protein